MEKVEIIANLNSLLTKINDVNSKKAELEAAYVRLNDANSHNPSNLSRFDNSNKDMFIKEMSGLPPVKPSGVLSIVSKAKKQQYEQEVEAYNQRRNEAEAAYYERFFNQRTSLAEQDKEEKESMIRTAETRLQRRQEEYDYVLAILNADNFLHENFKNANDVKMLLEFFAYGRADTLKEATNLLFDEKRKMEEARREEEHRKEMILLEQKFISIAEESRALAAAAESKARSAESKAQRAQETAERALRTAESAERKATLNS